MSAVRRGDHDRGGEGVRSEEEGEGQRGSHGEGEEDGGRRSRQSSEEYMQSQQSAARKAWKRGELKLIIQVCVKPLYHQSCLKQDKKPSTPSGRNVR